MLRISGRYANMQEGNFLLLSTDGGIDHVDTLKIHGGEFDWQAVVSATATYAIVYPNNQQLHLWAHEGEHLTIEGDAQDLWHVKVMGNDENELYTQFRSECDATDTTGLRNTAARYIRQQPDSPVAIHLLSQYFAIPDNVPADSTQRLYDIIAKAQPDNPQVVTLSGLLQQRYALSEGKPMPQFDIVTTDSVHHSLAKHRGHTLILYFWAGWQGATSYLHSELQRLSRDGSIPNVDLLGYSLDVDSVCYAVNCPEAGPGADTLRRADRIPTHYDAMGFSSPLVARLGIRNVPTFLVISPEGKLQHIFYDIADLRRLLEKKKATNNN